MEIKLKKNGWHRKLQEYVFRNPPRYNNFCPYFWLTIYCAIVTFIIPIMPIVSLVKFIGKGCNMALSYIDRTICQPLYDQAIKNLSYEDVHSGWIYNDRPWSDFNETEGQLIGSYWNEYMNRASWKAQEKASNRFRKWKEITPDWKEQLEKIRKKREEELAKYYEEREIKMEKIRKEREEKGERELIKEKHRRERFTRIVTRTQKIVPWVLSLIGLVALWYLGVFCVWVYNVVNWSSVLHYGLVSLVLLAGAIVIAGFIWLIVKLVSKCKLPTNGIPGIRYLGYGVYPFKWLFLGFVWLMENALIPFGMGVGSGCSFLWQYIMAIKENNCPHIDWVDKDKDMTNANSPQND